MPGPAVILKQLHHLRQLATDLDAKIENAPKQLAVQQKRLANQEDAAKAAHEHIKQLAVGIREREGSIKATQTQIKKYEKQLDEAANNKEYATLQSEINQERDHIAKLEDEILTMMGESEEKTAQLPEVDKALEKARADFAQYEKGLQEKLDRFAAEKTRAQAELSAAEATLPEDARVQYARLISAKGTDCLAGVKGKTCLACYTEITSQMHAELKREVFLMCKNCGRMLYLED